MAGKKLKPRRLSGYFWAAGQAAADDSAALCAVAEQRMRETTGPFPPHCRFMWLGIDAEILAADWKCRSV